jgi:integrase
MTLKKYKTKKGVRYGYEIQFNHQRYSQSGYATKREAMEAESKELKTLQMRVNDLDLQFLIVERTKYIEENCTPDYLDENIRTFNRFITALKGKALVSDVSRDDIERHISSVYPKKHGYNYALKKVKALFQFGVERGWTKYNPCDGINGKATDKRLKYVPPQKDLDAVINTATGEDKSFLLVLKHTMARVNEIYNLTWEDVDLNNRQITLWTRKKKGGARTPRHLTINDTLYDVLSHMEKGGHVFTNKDTGLPYEDRKKLIIGLCVKAKVKRFTFHSFRHFGASQLAMKGVSLPEIQMILGHDNVITTSKYIQSLGINKTEAINLLE